MSKAGGTRPAIRVAATIGVLKWILVSIALLAGLITVIAMFADETTSSSLIGLGAGTGAILYALMIWVLFGWFEHSLRALAQIAANTGASTDSYQEAPPFQSPPAR
jgi:hypothetical protein